MKFIQYKWNVIKVNNYIYNICVTCGITAKCETIETITFTLYMLHESYLIINLIV